MEEIVAADPDVILVVTMGSDEEAALGYLEEHSSRTPLGRASQRCRMAGMRFCLRSCSTISRMRAGGRAMRILPRFYIPTLPARSAKGRAAVLLGLALLTLLAVLLSLRFGSQPISASQMLDALRTGDEKSVAYRILRYMRLPRTVAGLVAGGALALAGTLIQAVLNNVMASPNVIGVNAGAGFAAMLAVTLAPSAAALIPAAAFFGALCTALFIYLLAVRAGLSRTTLILAGVAVSSILTAGIDTLTLLYPDDVIGATGFMLGGFSGVTLDAVLSAGPYLAAGALLAALLAVDLNLLQLGEESAASLGLAVGRCGLPPFWPRRCWPAQRSALPDCWALSDCSCPISPAG